MSYQCPHGLEEGCHCDMCHLEPSFRNLTPHKVTVIFSSERAVHVPTASVVSAAEANLLPPHELHYPENWAIPPDAAGSALAGLSPEERIVALNEVRAALHEVSPLKGHPVDLIQWVPAEQVEANDYNPNTVAAPEMALLELSIDADGYTQPVVTWVDGERRETVDGFHRGEVGRSCESVRQSTMGYLPVTTIRGDREDRGDRVAATIRHNRARGRHRIDAMSEIVRDLARRNWSDKKIAKQLGMEPDEVLRLKQISGLAELFADRDFSEAWEPVEGGSTDGHPF